jgi:hypothetical protein
VPKYADANRKRDRPSTSRDGRGSILLARAEIAGLLFTSAGEFDVAAISPRHRRGRRCLSKSPAINFKISLSIGAKGPIIESLDARAPALHPPKGSADATPCMVSRVELIHSIVRSLTSPIPV